MTKKIKFNEAMERLSIIVEKLDDSTLPIEESLALFEEGLSLSSQCQKQLKGFEDRINTLVQAYEKENNDETNS